jgi:hypothetical protein
MKDFGIPLTGVNKLLKILQYNQNKVSKYIKEGKDLSPYLNDISVFDSYEKFGLNRNPVYDRSFSIPHFLNMAPIHPMPNDQSFNKSFEQIVEERAKELLNTNKRIRVCWSGGIDSTFVLFTLYHYANDKSQIIVQGNYSSIIESGNVFDKFIRDKINYDINIDNKINKDYFYVTGFQGNQLFGPTDDFFADRSIAFFHHTLGTPETIYDDYRKIDPELLNFLQPTIDASPRKIETIADLRWYCIFNFDWYNGLYELLEGEHFFNTEDFQKWAINTKDPWTKVKGDSTTHRWQMREALANYGLVDYSKRKKKAVSCFKCQEPNSLFLLEDKKWIMG